MITGRTTAVTGAIRHSRSVLAGAVTTVEVITVAATTAGAIMAEVITAVATQVAGTLAVAGTVNSPTPGLSSLCNLDAMLETYSTPLKLWDIGSAARTH